MRCPIVRGISAFFLSAALLQAVSSLGLSPLGSSSKARRLLQNGHDGAEHPPQQLEWPADYHSVPWLAPGDHIFQYENVTDLESLVKLQSSGGWVTVMIYSKPTARWALNLIYSLVQFSAVQSYVVATLEDEALADCQSWRLPCFNASWAMDIRVGEADKPALLSTPRFMQINWAKVKLLDRLLSWDYNVHFTDTDLIYARDVYRSYTTLFQLYQMDGTFMREHPVNTGAFAIRANARTKAMAKMWLEEKQQSDISNKSEQGGLAALEGKAYKCCETVEDCAEIMGNDVAAIFRHELQFEETNCPQKMGYPCHPDRLFLHAVCMTYGDKHRWFDQEQLWLVDTFAQPKFWIGQSQSQRYRRSGAFSPRVTLNNRTLAPHPWLPCRQPAWFYISADRNYRSYKHAVRRSGLKENLIPAS